MCMKKNYLIILSFLSVFVNSPVFAESPNYTVQSAYDYSKNTHGKFTDGSKVLFIVDFSNSMNETLGGRRKIDIALDALSSILPKINPNVQTGLRIYGHKSGFTYLQGCMASKLVVPLASNNARNILGALYQTSATGWTPITYSLKQAVNSDFAGVTGKKHIILLTDGGENCDESPCRYAVELVKTRDDISIDVIAFDLYDANANSQLKCTALATRGKFYTPNDSSSLARDLFDSIGVDTDVHGKIKISD